MLNIFTKYIAYDFFKFFTLFLTGFTLITLVGNLFSKLGDAFENWDYFIQFLKSTALLMPTLLELIIPLTVLLATIATFSALSRTSEIVAMRAAGLGFIEIALPVLGSVVIISFLSYLNQNYLYTWMHQAWQQEKLTTTLPPLWRFGNDQRLYYFGARYADHTVESIAIFKWTADPYRIIEHTVIEKGKLEKKYWNFYNIEQRQIAFQDMKIQKQLSDQISVEQLPPVSVSLPLPPHHQPFWRLYDNIQKLKKEGQDVTLHWVEFYQKIGYSFTLFIMVLIGVSLSATHARQSKASEALAISCLLGIFFWIANQIFLALGGAGVLPPALGANMANLIFVFVAAGLLYQNRI